MVELQTEFTPSTEILFSRVDALFVLGIGGGLQSVGPKRRSTIAEPHMRLNAIATKEIANKGYLPQTAVIIPTGKGTEIVDWHYQQLAQKQVLLGKAQTPSQLRDQMPGDLSYLDFQRFLGQPGDEAELKRMAQATQGNLMAGLIHNAAGKPSDKPDRTTVTQEVLAETKARTTILNVINALNMLDQRTGKMWEGNVGILTTNTGHLQRAQEVAKALGLGRVLLLSSEQILLHRGYNKDYLNKILQVSEKEIKEHEKNLRGLREIPEFLIPEIIFIENDARLMNVVAHLETYYGVVALKKYDVDNYRKLSASQIREKIAAVGISRTKAVLDACSDNNLQELGIADLDKETHVEEIRERLAGGVKQAETIRKILGAKYGGDASWLEKNDLIDVATTEWYRIKNWLFGRKLPPNDWGESAIVEEWLNQNREYDRLTEVWLTETTPKTETPL